MVKYGETLLEGEGHVKTLFGSLYIGQSDGNC